MIALALLVAAVASADAGPAAPPSQAKPADAGPVAEKKEEAKKEEPKKEEAKAGEAKKDDGTLPASVEELFKEKDDDGNPVLGEAERKALKKLSPGVREHIGKDVDDGTVAGPEHLKKLLKLDMNSQTADIVFGDNCVLCHTDPAQKKTLTFSIDPKKEGTNERLNLKEVIADVHFRRGLMCAGCHGGKPTDTEMTKEIGERWPDKDVRHTDRTWIPQFCARCHSDPIFMRDFNPSLPTDQFAKYQDSRHGQLLLKEKDSKAAQCVSCHGVHGIRDPKSRNSTVFAQNIPTTCGHCHADKDYMAGYKKDDGSPLPTNQLEQYKKSVHGKALLEKGDLSAPACNDCHGNHAAMPPAVSAVSQVCRTCHVTNGTLFDGSKHKKAFEEHKWPECEKCHGKHDIEKPNDDLISAAPDGLCGSCHKEYSKDNPKCNEGAKYFHATLVELAQKEKSFPDEVEHLAERGLDVEPITGAEGELGEALVNARTRVHTFDKGGFDVGAKAGREAVEKTEQMIVAARAEQAFRRNGLLASIGVMAFLAFVLWLRIRQLDQQRERERSQKQG